MDKIHYHLEIQMLKFTEAERKLVRETAETSQLQAQHLINAIKVRKKYAKVPQQ